MKRQHPTDAHQPLLKQTCSHSASNTAMLCLHTQCCYRARVVDGCRRLVAFRTRPRAEHKEGAGTLHDCGPCPSLLRPAKLSHRRFGIRQIGIMGGRGRGRRAVRFANQPQVGRAGRVCCLSAKSVRYNCLFFAAQRQKPAALHAAQAQGGLGRHVPQLRTRQRPRCSWSGPAPSPR